MINYDIINHDGDLQLSVNSYEPPRIEILEFAVEKGFAASSEGWDPDTW